MKIGIFGGSFDPVHNGHLNLVKLAIERFELDRVIVVPAFLSPFKTNSLPVIADRRLMLVRSAFNGIEKVSVDDREIRRGGVSFAIDTVRELKKEFPDDELIFLIGADSEEGLPRWKNYDELKTLCEFRVLPRTEESSTEVRRRLQSGEDIRDLVPYPVAEFLAKGVRYNEDEKIVNVVLKGLEKKQGFCPCRLPKTPEYFCPCDEFKSQLVDSSYHGLCHCRLYFKP